MIHRNKKLLSIFMGLLLLFSSLIVQGGTVYANDTEHEPENPGIKAEQLAEGDQGMVVTAHPLASKVGADVLRRGGNAVDAAVAIQYALNVVEPMMSGIGGGGFMMYYDAKTEDISVINSRERAPAGATPDMFMTSDGTVMPFPDRVESGRSVGVPGTLKGLETALFKWGTMPMDELIQPAINMAEDGVEVNWVLADAIAGNTEKLSRTAAKDVFLPNGEPLKEGDLLVQKDLAKTFKLIADQGTDVFYDGEISLALADVVQDFDGSMATADLKRYNVTEDAPAWGDYQGYDIASMPPPSSGGLTMLQLLKMFEKMDLTQHDVRSPEKYHLMTEALHLAYADRGAYMGDPEYIDVPKDGLLHPDYIKQRVDLIDPDHANQDVQPGDPWDFQKGDPGQVVEQIDDKINGETTHFTVADKWGNLVSYTTTNEQLFGSGIMVPGYGVMLNNELTDFDAIPGGANEVQPNKRPLSSMTPTIILKDNKPFMTVGSPGGTTIIASVMQTIVNTIGYNMDLKDAIEEPRIFSSSYPTIRWENGVPDNVRGQLEQMGHTWETKPKEIGNVNSTMFDDEKGVYVGAADSTREGMAIGLSSPSLPYMKELVDQYARFNDIKDADAARLLKTHLTAVAHYKDTGKTDKAVKHMRGLKQLMERQKRQKLISDQAYEVLKSNADSLLEDWEES
ncbi:gamma-glutamyltransferase [Lentibacillus sp. L22]|uniref:gamma-glutamyltransferase n=1 Tax=Lentibacillus sp. L22 TaxID=3163028 RepID=UPI0034666911